MDEEPDGDQSDHWRNCILYRPIGQVNRYGELGNPYNRSFPLLIADVPTLPEPGGLPPGGSA